MSALPASPRIAAGEKIYRKIVALCARYNGGKDTGIVMRGWDADLKALITQSCPGWESACWYVPQNENPCRNRAARMPSF